MVRTCFEMLAAHRPGEIYDLTLRVIIGFLRRVYEQPKDGHRVYPLSVTDANNPV